MRLDIVYQKVLPHFYLRRDKRLIAHEASSPSIFPLMLQLPEKRDLVVFCPLAERQIRAYQALIDSEGQSNLAVISCSTGCLDVQHILERNQTCECGSGKTSVGHQPCFP